jgi:hypothetical protein
MRNQYNILQEKYNQVVEKPSSKSGDVENEIILIIKDPANKHITPKQIKDKIKKKFDIDITDEELGLGKRMDTDRLDNEFERISIGRAKMAGLGVPHWAWKS